MIQMINKKKKKINKKVRKLKKKLKKNPYNFKVLIN